MSLYIILWILIILVFLSLYFHILGYPLFEIIVLLLISILILSELIRIEEKEKIESVVKMEISKKLEGIEKVLNFIMKNISKTLTIEHLEELHSRIASRIEKYEIEFNEKMKNEIEKIYKKISEIESKLNELKTHSSHLHKRIENMENYIFEEEEI